MVTVFVWSELNFTLFCLCAAQCLSGLSSFLSFNSLSLSVSLYTPLDPHSLSCLFSFLSINSYPLASLSPSPQAEPQVNRSKPLLFQVPHAQLFYGGMRSKENLYNAHVKHARFDRIEYFNILSAICGNIFSTV